jgi:hypothetical protein
MQACSIHWSCPNKQSLAQGRVRLPAPLLLLNWDLYGSASPKQQGSANSCAIREAVVPPMCMPFVDTPQDFWVWFVAIFCHSAVVDSKLVAPPWLDESICMSRLPCRTCSTNRLGSVPARTLASKLLASGSGNDLSISKSASRSSCLRFSMAVSVSVYWH